MHAATSRLLSPVSKSPVPSSDARGLPLGMVGAGRSRNGLGPFLATFAERVGFRVVGVAGRTPERGAVAASALAARLGHEVRAHPDLETLCGSGIAALLIASPVEHHPAALGAALAHRLPALCEKPLVDDRRAEAGSALIEGFAAAGIPLVEHCQWPYVLPALRPLLGRDLAGTPPKRVALGLAPARPGTDMVRSVLSHLLSVVQAVAPVDAETRAREVALERCAPDGTAMVLRCLLGGRGPVEAVLELRTCPSPPRPAWIAIDDVRADRRVTADYGFVFEANGRAFPVPDPSERLLESFAALVAGRAPRAEVARQLDLVRQRWRLYREILTALPPSPAGGPLA